MNKFNQLYESFMNEALEDDKKLYQNLDPKIKNEMLKLMTSYQEIGDEIQNVGGDIRKGIKQKYTRIFNKLSKLLQQNKINIPNGLYFLTQEYLK